MTNAITCPSCRRVLNLPTEVLNQLVQCPACKKQFHPAEASPVENVRPAAPKLEPTKSTAPEPPAPAVSFPDPFARPVDRRPLPAPPPPPAAFDVRRSDRRGKKELEDLCPACQAFVPRGVDRCKECGAQFEPEVDDYRPWEQAGIERRDSESHRGGLILTLGIVGIVTSFFFFICWVGIATSIAGIIISLIAIVMGRSDMAKMRSHAMVREGESLTSGGVICGIIGMCLNALGLIGAIALLAIMLK